MSTVVLYTTLGCHLCEQAKALINPLLTKNSWQLREVDIADDDRLIAKYGVRIPVLAIPNTDKPNDYNDYKELDWPFTANDITCSLYDEIDQNSLIGKNL